MANWLTECKKPPHDGPPIWDAEDPGDWDLCANQDCPDEVLTHAIREPFGDVRVASHWYWDGIYYRMFCSEECLDDYLGIVRDIAKGLGVAGEDPCSSK